MRVSGKACWHMVLSSVLLVVPIIFGCTGHVESKHEIPVRGAVHSVHKPDGSHRTYLEVVVGREFNARVPDDIDSIVVTGPNGLISSTMEDFNYIPRWRTFWTVKPDPPEVGSYTFEVTSGKNSGQATDDQWSVKKIPLPKTREFYPARGEAISCAPTTFSWNQSGNDVPLFYQVDVRDANRRHVYRSSYVREMKSLRLPPGVLDAGNNYQWRIRAADGPDWISLNNRSESPWVSFSTSDRLGICEYRYRQPMHTEGGWAVASLDENEVDVEKIQALMHRIYADQFKNIHSILLVKNGKLILEEYFHGFHRNLKHHVASVTKSVTSILIGIAGDQGGEIDLDKKLIAYLPEYKAVLSKGAKSDIALADLLTMRAGLDWNEFSRRHFQQLVYESKDAVKYVLEKKLVDPPGQHFFYSTGLSTVLGRILKNTTGLDPDRFAAEYLFTPLGIGDYYWERAHDGTVLTGSALYLRPRDMAKLGYLYLNDGVWQEKQIVSQEWVRESIFPHVTYPRDKGDLISGTGYGYQWWLGSSRIADTDVEAFYAAGHGGQFCCVLPSLNAIIVITSQIDDNDTGDFRAYGVIDNYLLPALLQKENDSKTIAHDAENYRRITGRYQWAKADLGLKIFMDNGKLFGQTILFNDRFELLPVRKNRFMCVSEDVGKFWLDALEGSNGNIESIKLEIGFSYIPFKRQRGLIFGI